MKKLIFNLMTMFAATIMTTNTCLAAAGNPTSGTCGDADDPTALTWQFDMLSGTLTISGTGAMADYASPSATPWHGWTDAISNVVFGEGITRIGDYAFCSIPLKSVQPSVNESKGPRRAEAVDEPVASALPEGLTSIGKFSLNDTRMTSLTLPSTLVSIGESALAYNSQLATLTFLGTMNVPWFDSSLSDILAGCSVLTAIYVPENCVDDYRGADCWTQYASLIQAIPEGGGSDGNNVESVKGSEVVSIPSGEVTDRSSSYLPSNHNCKYSMSQQIYMKEEIGKKGKITSIAFYCNENGSARSYDIYLTHTAKQSFNSNIDWVTVAPGDKVFSGQVTMAKDQWTVIDFDTPFEYNGTQNLLVTVDDNTNLEAGYCSFKTFDSSYDQALYYSKIFGTPVNLDPTQPIEESGAYYGRKNQIQLCLEEYPKPTKLTAVEVTDISAQIQCTLRDGTTAWNLRYRKVAAEGEEEMRYVTHGNITGSSFTIENLDPATQYEVQVQAVFAGDNLSEWTAPMLFYTSCCPAEDMSELLWSARGFSDCESAFKIVDHETGIEMAYISMANDNAFGGYLNLCCGRTYDVYWISNKRWPGSDDYCTFSLFYLPGDEFYSMMPGTAPEAPNGEEGTSYLMTTFVMDCTPYCTPMPRFVTATDVTYQGATFTYQATTLKEELQYSTDSEFPESQTTTIEVTRTEVENETTYMLRGLESLTIYYVRLRSMCDDGEPGDGSRWTKPVRIITDTKYAPPTRPTADPRDARTEDIGWKRQGMENLNNVNYRTKGAGTPADDPMLIDLDEDGNTFESWGGTMYGSMGEKGVDNVIAIYNVPANAVVSWQAADGNSAKIGGNTVRFQHGFYKQSKKFNSEEVAAAQEELTQILQGQRQQEQEAQQSSSGLQALLKQAKELEKEIEQQSAEGNVNPFTKLLLNAVRNKIQSSQQAAQALEIAGGSSAMAGENNVEQQPNHARSMRAPESNEGDFYFFFIRHTDPDEILLIKDIMITASEDVGEWITIPDVTNVDYTLKGLQPATEYEVMVEPVYDGGIIGLASPITIFNTIGQENDPVVGEFSVGEDKTVQFAHGNLRHTGDRYEGKWSLAPQQYDILGQDNIETYPSGSYTAELKDLFCWSAPKNYYGVTFLNGYGEEEIGPMFQGDFFDWGTNPELIKDLGTGWQTLSNAEWNYLLTQRENATQLMGYATVADVKGIILLPDNWSGPALTATYTAEAWATLENDGAVFLPAAGQMTSTYDAENWRTTTTVSEDGTTGFYWSGSPSDELTDNSMNEAYGLTFSDTQVECGTIISRRIAIAVRLVKSVQEMSFSEYKADKRDECDAMAMSGDDDHCRELINNAKKDIAALRYDGSKTLEENKAAVDAIVERLATDLSNYRGSTGVKEIKNELRTKNALEGIYDLQGRKVSSPNVRHLSPGIYIVNGKKIVIK